MDTSKAAVFPLAPTKLVLQELLEASGPFDRALLQQMQRTVKPRDEQKIHAYDKLVSITLCIMHAYSLSCSAPWPWSPHGIQACTSVQWLYSKCFRLKISS